MGALKLGLALPAVLAVAPATADPVERWRPIVAEAARRTGLPEAWIRRVMRAESNGRTTLDGRPIRSPRGAIGLMQLMPGTWHEMRARLGLGDDPDDPRDNVLAGAVYLRMMYDRFGYPGLFAAYNAGPARYAAWLAGRARLPAETVAYLAKVGTAALAPVIREPVVPTLFVFLHAQPGASSTPLDPVPPAVLFAIRKAVP